MKMPQDDHNGCSRRTFLKGCGLTLTGFSLTSLFPSALIEHALGAVTNSNRRLLFIFLRGGNDGINALIPHGDLAGYSLANRPTLYIDPVDAIDLGNSFASFHPALADMMDAFNAGELAAIHRVGYPNSSQSHFDGQRIWENGDPAQATLFEGWLYRYVQESALAAGVNLPVFTAQGLPPLLLRGEEKFVNVSTPESFSYIFADPNEKAKASAMWRDQFAGLTGVEPYRPILSQTGVKLVDTIDEYASWDQANWNPLDPNPPHWPLFPVNGATNQAGFDVASYSFFAGLKVAALSLLESDGINNNGTRIAGTEVNGWDTHDAQGQQVGTQAELLSWLAYGFRSLRLVLSGAVTDDGRSYSSIWDDTAVVTLSEFGRTTKENGNAGTDHAAASCLFLQGGTVDGGKVYNCDAATWPAGVMLGIDGRYLLHRTDYRAIFWELLRDHMGADPLMADTVFPSYTSSGLGGQELGLIV
jgi:uncharacterized protein (DUF1501 family)